MHTNEDIIRLEENILALERRIEQLENQIKSILRYNDIYPRDEEDVDHYENMRPFM